MNKQIVWTFTNKKQLSKPEFLDYVERKVFRTIRKYNMLPENRVITIKKSENINTQVLKYIIEKKFEVKFSNKTNISQENLSEIAEKIFSEILKGVFKRHIPINQPLYYLSDKEIELYAKLTNIKAKSRAKDKRIQLLFEKFMQKNPDLEHNIINAAAQLK